MAFIILNDEEVSLLNEGERIQYEKELELHQQRVAFLERMEQLENANIESFHPQVKPILVIDKPEVKSLKKAEYDILVREPIEIPNLDVKEFKKVEPKPSTMPLMPKLTAVQTKYVHKPVVVQPDLPMIDKPKAVEVSFKRPQAQPVDLPMIDKPKAAEVSFKRPQAKLTNIPTVASPAITAAIYVDKLKDNLHPSPNHVPKVEMPVIHIKPFAAPEQLRPSLPDISVHVDKSLTFIKPEIIGIELPTVVKPEIHAPNYKGMQSVQLSLPHIPVAASFAKCQFQTPKRHNIALPTVAKLEVGTVSFKMPEMKQFDLPHIAPANIKVKPFDKLEAAQPIMAVPTISSAPAKMFTMTKAAVSNMPKLSTVIVPDAYAVLKELLLASS